MSRFPHPSLMPVLLGLALLAGAYLAFTTGHYFVHNYQLKQQQRSLHADLDQLDRDHARLVAVRDYLRSDEYIEYVARRVLGLVRPGQTLVIVSGATPVTAAAPVATPARTEDDDWWKDLFPETPPEPLATPAP